MFTIMDSIYIKRHVIELRDKMRLLHLTFLPSKSLWGGGERFIYNLRYYLNLYYRNLYKIYEISFQNFNSNSYSYSFIDSILKTLLNKVQRSRILRDITMPFRIIRAVDVICKFTSKIYVSDIIHIHHIDFLTMLPYIKTKNKTVLYTLHWSPFDLPNELRGYILHPHIYITYFRHLIRHVDAITVFSIYHYNLISNVYSKHKIYITPQSIDLKPFMNLPPKNSSRSLLNLPMSKKLILFIGRLHKMKGVDILIKAYASIEDRLRSLSKLLIVGSGPELFSLKRLVKKQLNIEDNVLFLGRVSDTHKRLLLRSCDIFILPSRYDVVPLTMIEALAAETPIIAPYYYAIPEYVKHRRNGLLFRPNDHYDLAQKIEELLDNDSLRREISRNNSVDRLHYSWDKNIHLWHKVYQELST